MSQYGFSTWLGGSPAMTNRKGRALMASVALLACAHVAHAQGAAALGNALASQQMRPYLQVKPVPGDTDVVRAFFSPSCTYSRSYFQFFKNLGATLPAGRTFAFTPLVNKGDGVSYALSFYAVQRYYPVYLNNFVEASLVGVQDKGLSTRNWVGIERIGRAAHVPVSVPQLVQQHKTELIGVVQHAIDVQQGLAITNTPSVSVAGTYIVTPEFTNGDAEMFSTLVNAVISMP